MRKSKSKQLKMIFFNFLIFFLFTTNLSPISLIVLYSFHLQGAGPRRGSVRPDEDEEESKYFKIKPKNQVVPEGKLLSMRDSLQKNYSVFVTIIFPTSTYKYIVVLEKHSGNIFHN